MPRRSRARRRTSAGTTKLRTAGRRAALAQSIRNFRLDQLRQLREGLLPAEIARLRRNDLGNAFLHDVQLGPARDLLQRDGDLHLARQVRVVELVGVADALVRRELEIPSAEGMAFAGGE